MIWWFQGFWVFNGFRGCQMGIFCCDLKNFWVKRCFDVICDNISAQMISFFHLSIKKIRCRQDLNLRGQSPMDFKSISLTTRTQQPIISKPFDLYGSEWWRLFDITETGTHFLANAVIIQYFRAVNSTTWEIMLHDRVFAGNFSFMDILLYFTSI